MPYRRHKLIELCGLLYSRNVASPLFRDINLVIIPMVLLTVNQTAVRGSTVHFGAGFHGSMGSCGRRPCRMSARTSTGSTPPVGGLNRWCPTTSRIDSIALPWAVREIQVLRSWVNMSSTSCLNRAARAELDSRRSGSQSSSVSVNPGSIRYVGYAAWIEVRELRRSHVWMPMVSRRS